MMRSVSMERVVTTLASDSQPLKAKISENREDAIVRLFNKIYSNQDWLPQGLCVGQPLIKPKGIDDVPIVAVTLWSEDDAVGAYELGQVAHAIEAELKRVPGTRDIYTIGVPTRAVKVEAFMVWSACSTSAASRTRSSTGVGVLS